jgi:hypothetical protein
MMANKLCRFFNWRDADYLFSRVPILRRLYATNEDKVFLEENGFIQVKRKYSVVCLVAARDAYHAFGHKILTNGSADHDWPELETFEYDEMESDFVDTEEFHNASAADTPAEPISEATRESRLVFLKSLIY